MATLIKYPAAVCFQLMVNRNIVTQDLILSGVPYGMAHTLSQDFWRGTELG